MQSPYKRILVYDLETGGLKYKTNSITEIAIVAIDLETLEIVDEWSSLILPRIDLGYMIGQEAIKVAKAIYKDTAVKDEDSGIKILKFKDHNITLKNMIPLEEAIEEFAEYINDNYPSFVLELEDILKLEADPDLADIMKVVFDYAYNPEALRVTHIGRDLFQREGLPYNEVFKGVKDMITKHTIGNSKPIMAGHNIGSLPRRIIRGKEKGPDGFDNPFMEKFFADFKEDFFFLINEKIIDTLKEARMIWYEAPGFNLGTCANSLGITLKEAHRALPDTLANAKVLVKMMKQYRGAGTAQSNYTKRKFKLEF